MKTAIVYYSKHHGNTKKVIDAIASKHEVDLIDVAQAVDTDLSQYDTIGLASGVYYSKFHKTILNFVKEKLPNGKNVFFIYTYGSENEKYTNAVKAAVLEKSAKILGSFGCPGFDTFGPFKLVGGVAKGRPNQEDIANALKFYDSISSM